MLHHLDYGCILNCAKGLYEVKLDYDNLFFGLLALVNVFKGLGKAVLNGPGFNEYILIFMH
jgi:hypothetical protein